jgi:hypothetical protein
MPPTPLPPRRRLSRLATGLLAALLAACGAEGVTAPEPFDTAMLVIQPARANVALGDTVSFTVTNRSSVSVTTASCWDVAWRKEANEWVTDTGLLPASCQLNAVTLPPGAVRQTLLRVPTAVRIAEYRIGYRAQRNGSGGVVPTASAPFAVRVP